MAIELDRQFVECRDDEQSDPDLIARYGRTDGTLAWPDLLSRRRVVLLAEAGSGKTTEMSARAREQARARHHAFYATVEDVGLKGLEAALRPADRAALAAWHSSDKEGWLFIDSVDEAKQSGVKLRAALRGVAGGIAGAERRAHVILSGRYTDWQFRHDLIHFNEELAIPADGALPVEVPDDEISLSGTTSVLDLADVLPDWSPQDRGHLLARAVFDPATFGRARIHNDNQGVVRSYLAARWLHRLRKSNLSQQGLLDLMFEETYGVPIIKPSMKEVAAWLSLWDEVVAREVACREPFLLLSAGDPASLSRQTRENLLTQTVERAVAGHPMPSLDFDSLKRFSRPDLAQVVRKLWGAHATHPDARRLLLRLIWLGGIKECADLAEAAVLGPGSNGRLAVFAGRALMTTADDAARKRYAAFVKTNCATLPTTVVWDALEELIPLHLGVDDLLTILSSVAVTDRDGGLGLDWHGPKLVERINSRAELERLLLGVLSQLGGIPAAGDREETPQEKAYFPMIASAAQKLLELCPDNEAAVAALDAAVRIGERAQTSRAARRNRGDLTAELQKSAARRRLAFWRFAERLAGHRVLGGRPIDSAWDLQMLGFPLSFEAEDIDWLLADAPTRASPNERQLAINTAMMIRRDEKLPDDVLKRVHAVVAADTAMTAALNSWIKPPPKPAEYTKSQKRLEQMQRRNAVERAAQDKSWVDFASELRADPDLMRKLRPTTPEGVDGKLFHLWDLLNHAVDSGHRYAIESVEPLMPMIGADATEAFRVGLIAHWRGWSPWLRSARKNEELNQIRSLDSMGIAGITLEAISTNGWAARLSDDDTRRAVGYATLELNGFPSWLTDLARANPDVVCAVLSEEIDVELARPVDAPPLDILRDVARGDAVTAELMAPFVLAELEKRPTLARTILSTMINIIVRGLPRERERLKSLAIERFRSQVDPAAANLYIGAVFAVDGAAATEAVLAKIKTLERADRPAFVRLMLPFVFGRQFSDDTPHIENLPLSSLERLIRLAFTSIRVEDDNVHLNGVVFSPDERDDAENARNAAFSRLLNTPGRATFDAILRLLKVKGFPISAARLREFAKERAAKDSEWATWRPSEVFAFEETAETEPQMPRDLQMVALRRLADMQYDLIHDDFQQGGTLAGLRDEKAVQNWIAERLRLKQGRSYSVEREVHVADEKEPDVRLRARATDASVPLEVKIAETWTLPQLEAALTTQLCDQYLRAREDRHGILLVVHQKPRPRGWTLKSKRLTFDAVVARLRTMAAKIAGSASDAPQPEVAVLDVSSFTQKKGAEKKPPKKKAAKKRSAKTKPAIRRKRAT